MGTSDIRNLALIGGPGTGKTSFAEALLHAAGATQRLGSIADGTTVSDFQPEEKEKKHSVELSLLFADSGGRRFNILDVPGSPDFIGEAAAALSVAENAVLFIDAAKGLSFPGRKIWELAGRLGRARTVVLTHVDGCELDWPATVVALSETLGARCLPVATPLGTGASCSGARLVPLTAAGAGGDAALAELTESLVEAAVEADDAAMTAFLEQDRRPSEEEAARLLARAVAAGLVVPVLPAASLDGRGAAEFLDFAARCLPSPADLSILRTVGGEPVPCDGAGTTAFVFKTVIDPFVGRLSMLRVVCGTLESGHLLTVARTGKSEKVAHLQASQGKEHVAVDRAVAGDIVAVPKLEALETSDTLSDPAHPRQLEPLSVPKAKTARSISPANHADDAKLSTALKRAAAEDPSFHYERDESTGQLIARGISPTHLETVLRRIKERNHVEVKVEVPRVPLRETIRASAEGHHRHKKQTGGRGQFAEVFLRVAPAERGAGLVFVDDTVGGSIPRQFLPAIEKGVREGMAKGIVAGYPVVDVQVAVYDGKYHDVDSDEASFKMAGLRAFRDGFQKARPVLLEPLLDMEVAIPSRFLGAITSDLTGRRGHITGMDSLGETQIVKVRVPQREVLTYGTALRSLSSGEGSFDSTFHDYEVVPSNIQQEIMAAFKPAEED